MKTGKFLMHTESGILGEPLFSERIALYYSVPASPAGDKLKLKIRKSWVQFLFGRFLFSFISFCKAVHSSPPS